MRLQNKPLLKVYDEDGTILGEYFTDLMIDERLIVELKAVRQILDEHVAQTLGYLKSSKTEHGLLINFGSHRFQIKKYILNDQGGNNFRSVMKLFCFAVTSILFFR